MAIVKFKVLCATACGCSLRKIKFLPSGQNVYNEDCGGKYFLLPWL